MKSYEITIRPGAEFGTPLKGDTLFGHFCWQAAYDPSLLDGGLDANIAAYREKPFVVFSSAVPLIQGDPSGYAVKRPDLPLSRLFSLKKENRVERYRQIKEFKKKKWMTLSGFDCIHIRKAGFITDAEMIEKASDFSLDSGRNGCRTVESREEYISLSSRTHNTINRITGTTGKAPFAPWTVNSFRYKPGVVLAVIVVLDEHVTGIEQVRTAMKRIGEWGFGKDASTGFGRFEVESVRPVTIAPFEKGDACYTLAPCVPEPDTFDPVWFTPFVRFGKHGDRLARSANPFKNPVFMADEGAVLVPKGGRIMERPYVGRAVEDVSLVEPETVVQGYAPWIPMKLER